MESNTTVLRELISTFREDLKRILRITSFNTSTFRTTDNNEREFPTYTLVRLNNNRVFAAMGCLTSHGVYDGFLITNTGNTLVAVTYPNDDEPAEVFGCDECGDEGLEQFWHCCECSYDLCRKCHAKVEQHPHHMVHNVEYFGSDVFKADDISERTTFDININPS